MYIFYIIPLLPVFVVVTLWFYFKKINTYEALGWIALNFTVAGFTHAIVLFSQLADTEMWNGKVETAVYVPPWESVHTRTVTTTDSKGNTSSHTETYYEDEGNYYYVIGDFGRGYKQEIRISRNDYNRLYSKFGGKKSVRGHRPSFHSGDRNDYPLINKNNWFEPIVIEQTFENRLKNTQTLFSHIKLPENYKGFPYPHVSLFNTNRLFGPAKVNINKLEFDRFNTRIGPRKKVNVIIVGFTKGTSVMDAQYLEAKWLGGKKNDLVLCFGTGDSLNKAEWSYVFGWTEKELVKRNLETILLNNSITTDILSLIESEIIKNYTIKDWSKFDYITIEPPMKSYFIFMIMLVIINVGFGWWAFTNDVDGFGIEK